MTVADLIPELHALNDTDKIRVIQLLATDLAHGQDIWQRPSADRLIDRPLRGTVTKFDRPFDPVATDDWDAVR